MSRNLDARLRKLESQQSDQGGRWHRIMGRSDEELDAKRAALMASPDWSEGDHTIAIRFVTPTRQEDA